MAQTAVALANLSVMSEFANPVSREKPKPKPEPLFGPHIGIVPSGPSWTNLNEKKVVNDELTTDIVRSWTERSKESQVTTTLQALVNLKRPTLRLSPLTASAEEGSQPGTHHHGLEFEYDCDAPKCGLYVSVLVSPEHPEASPHFSPGLTKILVFEQVVAGGFAKKLTIAEGAMLELGRFEHVVSKTPSQSEPSTTKAEATSSDAAEAAPRTNRKRFTHFNFRKRSHNASVSGPALAVVDAEPSHEAGNKDKEEFEGVRIMIRLAALDEQGTELSSPNEQVTYLEVVRFGAAPEDDAEDTRSWVVRVVKREATIGPHTFHLHEIYGLTSKSSHASAPVAPLPSEHTYPPATEGTGPAIAPVTEDDPSSECLLCLSSPREVILLPCRHLVACKDCALNMVEFGAGGTITQAEEAAGEGGDAPSVPPAATADADVPAVEDGAGAAPTGASATENEGTATATAETPAGETAATPASAATPAAPTSAPAPAAAPEVPAVTRRRKRKAKGWFCPVCRQPYTSLLRITTNPPPPEDKEAAGTDPLNAAATNANAAQGETAVPPASPASPGILGFRPSFLRQFSRNPQPDLERGQA